MGFAPVRCFRRVLFASGMQVYYPLPERRQGSFLGFIFRDIRERYTPLLGVPRRTDYARRGDRMTGSTAAWADAGRIGIAGTGADTNGRFTGISTDFHFGCRNPEFFRTVEEGEFCPFSEFGLPDEFQLVRSTSVGCRFHLSSPFCVGCFRLDTGILPATRKMSREFSGIYFSR